MTGVSDILHSLQATQPTFTSNTGVRLGKIHVRRINKDLTHLTRLDECKTHVTSALITCIWFLFNAIVTAESMREKRRGKNGTRDCIRCCVTGLATSKDMRQ